MNPFQEFKILRAERLSSHTQAIKSDFPDIPQFSQVKRPGICLNSEFALCRDAEIFM